MQAIIQDSEGAPDVLKLADAPMPELQPGEILIRVKAAGVSHADLLQRQGKYPPPPGASSILGLEVAGTVENSGQGATRFRAGDRVCAVAAGGGYAEFCAVPEPQVLPIPENWSFLEAATLPENLFTVYDNMVTRGRLKAGETVLIHGGTSGIGSMAIMLARALGATPYATAGTDAKCEAAKAFGAEAAINYRSTDFVESLRQLTGGQGADVIVDLVGGSYLERNVNALALEGRLCLIAVLGGATGMLPIHKLMRTRGSIVASTLRARTPAEKGAVADCLREKVWPMLPAKRFIRPLIDRVFPLAEAAKAHERLESGVHMGKIVLSL
jgi:putative PIG3 family NAD(P)H quinone oxidoreductase